MANYISPQTAATQLTLIPELTDIARYTDFISRLGDRRSISVAEFRQAFLAGKEDDAANKAIERFVKRLNSSATAAGVDVGIEVRGGKAAGPQGRTIGFVADDVNLGSGRTPELDANRANLIEGREAIDLTARRLTLKRGASGKFIVQVFLSWARADREDAKKLWELLRLNLVNSKEYEFVLWSFADQLLVGEEWDATIRAALAQANLAIFAVSNAFLASEYISNIELPAFVNGIPELSHKRAIPVLLKPIDPSIIDLKGLHAKQIFCAPNIDGFTKSAFSKAGRNRDTWAAALALAVHRVVRKYAIVDAPGGVEAEGEEEREGERDDAEPDSVVTVAGPPNMGDHDFAGIRSNFVPLRAAPGGLRTKQFGGSDQVDPAGARVDVLDQLMDWLRDTSRPLAALLGEYGMGKTITSQALADRVKLARLSSEGSLPEPMYFDLRQLANLRKEGNVPALAEIMDEVIGRSWTAVGPLPTATELIERAKTVPTMFIFDGLDEALIHLDMAQGRSFTAELLRLRPSVSKGGSLRAGNAGTHTKLLISCRTHYFPTLRSQTGHFSQQHRDGATADDYIALVLLPLDDEQIRTYLGNALPDRNADQVIEMLRSIHDLSDLTTRPFTLAQIANQIPELEQRRAEGRPVHSSTIYGNLVLTWLERDEGKHKLTTDHKLALTSRLAAWMWRRGGRLIENSELEAWLHQQLADAQEFTLRYRGENPEKLEEDLRTATFLVRDDATASGGFRFAHSSILEFFLARYLFEALVANRRNDWVMPVPSDETLDFLGQLLAEHHDSALLIKTLGSWRGPYLPLASELLLRYGQFALSNGWPTPSLARLDLSGADLRGWKFVGTRGGRLNLAGSNLANTDLRRTDWDSVDLTDADLSHSRLDNAIMNNVRSPGMPVPGASLRGALLRDTQIAFRTDCDTRGLRAVRVAPAGELANAGSRGELHSLSGGGSTVKSCAFSQDGSLLATASFGGIVRVWNTLTWESIVTLRCASAAVAPFSFDPASTMFAVVSDGAASIWDTSAWIVIQTLNIGMQPISWVTFSPVGNKLASGGYDGVVQIWDTSTWTIIQTLNNDTHPTPVSASFSADGDRVAINGSDGLVQIWDTSTWSTIETLKTGSRPISPPAFSAGGAWLAISGSDGLVQIWDTSTWTIIQTVKTDTHPISLVAFSPEADQLITVTLGGTMRIWDTLAWEEAYSSDILGCRSCALNPKGSQLVLAGTDGTVVVLDPQQGNQLQFFAPQTSRIWLCVPSPDGSTLITVTDLGLEATVWDTATWMPLQVLAGHRQPLSSCTFSPEGSKLAIASHEGSVAVWDTTSWAPIESLMGNGQLFLKAAFSPDGRALAAASEDGSVTIWNVGGSWETAAVLVGHSGPVLSCAFSPDGTTLSTGGDDGATMVWDTATWQKIAQLPNQPSGVISLVYRPDGSTLTTITNDGTARSWSTIDWEVLSGHHPGGITSLVYRPDSSSFLTGSIPFGPVWRVWDTCSMQPLRAFDGDAWIHVSTAAFTHGGTSLVAAGWDGTVRVLDTTTWKTIVTLCQSAEGHAAWSPADQRLISAGGDAWRWLRVNRFDGVGRFVGSFPYELFYPTLGEGPAILRTRTM